MNLENYYLNGKLEKEENKYYQSKEKGGYKGYSWVYINGNGNVLEKKNDLYNKEVKSSILNKNYEKKINKGKSYIIENKNSNIQNLRGYTQTYYIGGGNNNFINEQQNQQRTVNQIEKKNSINDDIYNQINEKKKLEYNNIHNLEEKNNNFSENILISENSENNINKESNSSLIKKDIIIKKTKNRTSLNDNAILLNNSNLDNLDYYQKNLKIEKNKIINSNNNMNVKNLKYNQNYQNSNTGTGVENNSQYAHKYKNSNIYIGKPKNIKESFVGNISDNLNFNNNEIYNNLVKEQYNNINNNNIKEEKYNKIIMTKKVTNIKYEKKK